MSTSWKNGGVFEEREKRMEAKRGRGRPTIEEAQAKRNLEMRSFKRMARKPAKLVACLASFGGDVSAFLFAFTNQEDMQMAILTQTLLILGRLENEQLMKTWDDNVTAFERAKVLYAKQKAFQYIAEYDIPETKDGNPQTLHSFVSYARFWLASHHTTETASARQNVAQRPAKDKARDTGRTLEKVMESLMSKTEAVGDTDY